VPPTTLMFTEAPWSAVASFASGSLMIGTPNSSPAIVFAGIPVEYCNYAFHKTLALASTCAVLNSARSYFAVISPSRGIER
jgi:hypothetical protein